MKIKRPHLVLNECTPKFPSGPFFRRVFGEACSVDSFTVSPEAVGLPTRRPRLLTVIHDKTALSMNVAPVEVFFNYALKSITIDGAVYFVAPLEFQNNYKRYLLKLRGCHANSADLSEIPWKSCLSFCGKKRLRGYEEAYETNGDGDTAFCNIACNPGYARATHFPKTVMTLLKNSMIYDLKQQRMVTPLEALAINGIPLFYDSLDKDLKMIPDKVFLEMSPGCAKAMAGNMMNIPTIGTLIAIMLHSFDFASPPPPDIAAVDV